MPRLATTGNTSCASMAIGGFKFRWDPIKDNEEYLADKNNYVLYENSDCKLDDLERSAKSSLSVGDWFNKIMFPVAQDLGESRDYPFDMLMDLIEKNEDTHTKHLSVLINQRQYMEKDMYWPKRFKERGFKLCNKFNNDIGYVNYLFEKTPLSVPIAEEDKEYV